MSIKQLDVPFEIKSIDEDGAFTGYGSVFGVLDSYKDIVMEGAFKETLKEWRKKGKFPALLWQHDSRQPIGAYKVMQEDKKGLYVEGQLALKVQKAAEAHELMKLDAISGLSIGFQTKNETWDQETGIRELNELKLFEVSLVTFPANEAAQVTAVKEILRDGGIPSERELEKYLRDVGFSQSKAKAIMAGGYKALSQRDVGDSDLSDQDVIDLKSSLDDLLSKFK